MEPTVVNDIADNFDWEWHTVDDLIDEQRSTWRNNAREPTRFLTDSDLNIFYEHQRSFHVEAHKDSCNAMIGSTHFEKTIVVYTVVPHPPRAELGRCLDENTVLYRSLVQAFGGFEKIRHKKTWTSIAGGTLCMFEFRLRA
jgi:hypothetical protein